MLVVGGTIVNEGTARKGTIVVENDHIADIIYSERTHHQQSRTTIDATGCLVLPGAIDTHVHFRQPGLTWKADIQSESQAAAVGGVTTYFDMPNTQPPTTTIDALDEKRHLAQEKSHVNYAFFLGATQSNSDTLARIDSHKVAGIKLFMGSTTGDMLVDNLPSLRDIFRTASHKGLVLVAHCEDTATIARNTQEAKSRYGVDDPPIESHPAIRSEEACLKSARLAASLAREYGTRLHLAHISTQEELDLLGGNVTGEVCLAHLLFDSRDYATLGTKIKCNPAVKDPRHRRALIEAVRDSRLTTIATDHAPHLLREKEGGAIRALSGMPMVQYSLPAMLTLAQEENIPPERVVQMMCHNPATLFGVRLRGFLRKGYKADITIVRAEEWTIDKEDVRSKCGWSPLEGRRLKWKVAHTILNGQHIYANHQFAVNSQGEEIEFIRPL